MWSSRRRRTDARNVLLDAALEFGTSWRRDVATLASERLLDLDDNERTVLAQEVEDARTAIELWVMARWEAVGGHWTPSDSMAAKEHVRAAYPWMDERNVGHAVNQATYYAWHG